jgi:hypothetical protein
MPWFPLFTTLTNPFLHHPPLQSSPPRARTSSRGLGTSGTPSGATPARSGPRSPAKSASGCREQGREVLESFLCPSLLAPQALMPSCPLRLTLPNAYLSPSSHRAGYYCPNVSASIVCPKNFFCKAQSIAPMPCSILTQCPEATGTPQFSYLAFVIAAVVSSVAILHKTHHPSTFPNLSHPCSFLSFYSLTLFPPSRSSSCSPSLGSC